MELNDLKKISNDIIEEAKKCKDINEFKAFLNLKKIKLSDQDIKKAFDYIHQPNKTKIILSELESVSGGKGGNKEPPPTKKTIENSNNENNINLDKELPQ